MLKYKVIGGDQQEYGPTDPGDIVQWIEEGRLSAESLIKVDGEEQWRPLAEFSEFADPLREQARRLGRGVPPSIPVEAGQSFGGSDAPAVNVGACFSRSLALLSTNFGLLFGATFLVWSISVLLQFLPLVGLVYWVIWGVLYGGLLMVFLKRIRGEETSMADVFTGFGTGFNHLMLAGILTSFLTQLGFVMCLVPGVYLAVSWIFALPLIADRRMEFWAGMESSRRMVGRFWGRIFLLALFAFLPVILANLATQIKITSEMLAYSRETLGSASPDLKVLIQNFPKMMEQVAKTSASYILITKVVLLFNLPLALGALMYAYEDLFGRRTSERS